MFVRFKSEALLVMTAKMTQDEAKNLKEGLKAAVNNVVLPKEQLYALNSISSAITERLAGCAACSKDGG